MCVCVCAQDFFFLKYDLDLPLSQHSSAFWLLNYDKHHDYFGQYCNHDYLKLLLVGHMTKTLY